MKLYQVKKLFVYYREFLSYKLLEHEDIFIFMDVVKSIDVWP